MQITLKAARVNAGLTQKTASEELGISFQTLSKYENDSSNIPYGLLENMAKLYLIPKNYIFLGKSTKKIEQVNR